jgi:hypothetical protein
MPNPKHYNALVVFSLILLSGLTLVCNGDGSGSHDASSPDMSVSTPNTENVIDSAAQVTGVTAQGTYSANANTENGPALTLKTLSTTNEPYSLDVIINALSPPPHTHTYSCKKC